MPQIEMPMNTAHQHAANADDFLAQGLLIPASEEHYKAAEAYLAAVERTNDENTKRTLRMLYKDHCKAGKELQRKILKLREENKDPSLPQKPDPPPRSTASTSENPDQRSRQAASPPPSAYRMSDSQNKTDVDESFMVLGQRSDPGDAFNQFWKIMEGMENKLSQPVAFATVPLGVEEAVEATRGLRSDGSLSSDTDIEDPVATRNTRRIGIGKDKARNDRSLGAIGSKLVEAGSRARPPASKIHEEDFEDDMLDSGDELSESFCLIPSGSNSNPVLLKKENVSLKAEVDVLQKRLAAAERVLKLKKEQDQQLKDSIVMARREAHRVMGASTLLTRPAPAPIDFANLNLNVPSVPPPITALTPGRDREAQLLRRVRELEEEVRSVRLENEKQKAMIAKFRERWEKLKESAKRKKDAKAAGASVSAAHERIEEEPEAEQDLDDGNS